MRIINTPERVLCDRLLLNDTAKPACEVARVVRRYAARADIAVIDRSDAADRIRPDAAGLASEVGTLLLPGSSARICADALDPLPPGKILRVAASRRLSGFAPRGLDLPTESELALVGLRGDYLLIDDVVASGTTVNGIVKRAKSATLRACATLAVREINQLRAGTSVLAGLSVERSLPGFARINTLGTLLEPGPKRDAVAAALSEEYGAPFVASLLELLND